MLPRFTAFDVADGHLMDAVMGRYLLLRSRVAANFSRLPFGQLGVGVSFATAYAALRAAIFHVFGLASDEQMVRSNAGWRIAFVQDVLSRCDRSVVENPRHSMRVNEPAIHREAPVALIVQLRRPQPATTIVWNDARHLFPESKFGGYSFASSHYYCTVAH